MWATGADLERQQQLCSGQPVAPERFLIGMREPYLPDGRCSLMILQACATRIDAELPRPERHRARGDENDFFALRQQTCDIGTECLEPRTM